MPFIAGIFCFPNKSTDSRIYFPFFFLLRKRQTKKIIKHVKPHKFVFVFYTIYKPEALCAKFFPTDQKVLHSIKKNVLLYPSKGNKNLSSQSQRRASKYWPVLSFRGQAWREGREGASMKCVEGREMK